MDVRVGLKLKNWCFWTEKTRRSNLSTLKEISTEHSIGRSDAEDPIFWPPDMKNWLIEKDADAGKDWRQEENGITEDEIVGWHHWIDRYEFAQAAAVDDGQGSLVCCSPWDCEDSDMAEWLTWTYSVSGIHKESWNPSLEDKEAGGGYCI